MATKDLYETVILQVKLDKLLDIPDKSVAVYWYARNCKRSEIILRGRGLAVLRKLQ